NTDSCHPAIGRLEVLTEGYREAPWTTQCGVLTYSDYSSSWMRGGVGGNGVNDTAIASQDGDIYFYSPELLDGDRGIEGQENLYDYREGRPRFVATFKPDVHCTPDVYGDVHYEGDGEGVHLICSEGPITRLEVSPDGSHAAFVAADRLTSYDNAG